MEAEIRKALGIPKVRTRMLNFGIDLVPKGEEEFRPFLSRQIATWGQVVRENNIRPD